MFGNDIVDLSIFRQSSLSGNDKFYRKVFSEAEYRSITQASNPDLRALSIWTLKEAAYKSLQRENRSLIFQYKKFETDERLQYIRYKEHKLSTEVLQTTEYIHGIAFPVNSHHSFHLRIDTFDNLMEMIDKKLYNPANMSFESFLVREQAKLLVQQLHHLPITAQLLHIDRIRDKTGKIEPPFIKIYGEPSIPVSLSHHGKFFSSMIFIPKKQ